MSDLENLMKKLKKSDAPSEEEEVKKAVEEPIEEEEDEDELEDLEEEDDEEEKPKASPKKEIEERVEEVSAKEPTEEGHNPEQEETIMGEVGILQNNGIFRRELLVQLREQNEVLKIIAEAIIKKK